ncbi:hypothetical protein BJ165DRAFT_1411590 [Panaeolus papilionaceus]|nr:hypothetical protein BJ165DRAFT_1411590 [Panaeolus papilionaceus]
MTITTMESSRDEKDKDSSTSASFTAPQQLEELELGIFHKLSRRLLRWGIETHGIAPIADDQRIDKRVYQMFWLWFSVNFNILAFSTGSAGPAFFSLGIKDSLLVLLVVDVLAVFGPKLGTRGMVQCRFSWGLYGAIIPSALNALAASSSKLDDTLGIVIIGVISLVITFCGYRFLHWFESFAWVPGVISFPILLGVAGKHLNPSTFPSVPPASASQILSFACFVGSSLISWCTLTPDYGVYHDKDASSLKVFSYVYLGFFTPSIAWHMIGAAFAAAAPGIPSWQSGFEDGNNVGGLLAAALSPTKGFGKFLMVLIALSTSCACAPTMYTFGISFMAMGPFFRKVPRYVFAIISEAILIPVAIIGAKKFYATLVDILSAIGYWSTIFAAIVLIEHFVFRRGDFGTYKVVDWNNSRNLPLGVAAVIAFLAAFGAVVPCISQTWYQGPIAHAGTGDIGIIMGGVVGSLMYLVLRWIEKKLVNQGHQS